MNANLIAALILSASVVFGAEPLFEERLIFPPQSLHSHSSSVVELPDGRLMACWYFGSGERTADDVKLQASYLRKGSQKWEPPFTLADSPGFPDTNPILFVDRTSRLWLVWPTILDNHWESALLNLRIAAPGWKGLVPRWEVSDNLLLAPVDFKEKVRPLIQQLQGLAAGRDRQELQTAISRVSDKLYNRLGWMPRTHPLQLPSGRILVPLYSDTYSLSLVAITDDNGQTWRASDPLVSLGGVQPSLVRRKDGTIVAYMRDNGRPPKRVLVGESRDDGMTWGEVRDSDIPNPGSSVEVIALRGGSWCMVNNDTERGRRRLSVWLSDDEGKTWPWKRALENDAAGSFSYPSVIQARDGSVHVTYSQSRKPDEGARELQTIKHVRFGEEWVRQGRTPDIVPE